MKVPRYLSPKAIPADLTADLPAVAAVTAGGYLCEAAPVARFGTAKESMVYVLLSHGQRGYVERSIPGFDGYTTLMAPDYTRSAVMRPNGEPMRWFNAEHLWVSASWLAPMEAKATDQSHGAALVFSLVRQAAALS